MKFTAKFGWISSEEKFGDDYFYLRPDGTIETRLRGDKDWFKNKPEAQQFLDNWLPKKEWLTVDEVKAAAKLGELEALDCSIEHWKQIVLDVKRGQHYLGHNQCAICVRDEKLWNNYVEHQCTKCILNNYSPRKKTTEVCCDEYNEFRKNSTEVNAITMLNKLVKIRNKKYGEIKMKSLDVKELTVAEISEALGYEVKVVKEPEKPYIFKAGDVVDGGYGEQRLIVNIDGKLYSLGTNGEIRSKHVQDCNQYTKIGVLSDYIK